MVAQELTARLAHSRVDGQTLLSGEDPNALEYNNILRALAETKGWQQVHPTLKQMEGAGLKPNIVTYNLALNIFGKAGQWQEGLKMLQEMRAQGLKLEPYSYSAVVQAHHLGGNHEGAVEMMLELRRRGMWTRAVAYVSAIQACLQLHQRDRAARAEGSAAPPNLRPEAYHWETAKSFYLDLKRLGRSMNHSTYSALLTMASSVGQIDEALELLRELERDRHVPIKYASSYAPVLQACRRAGDWRMALELLYRMKEQRLRPADTKAHNTVLQALGEAGRTREALQVLQELKDMGGGLRPDVWSYSAVLKAFAENPHGEQWREAVELLREAQAAGLAVNRACFNSVLRACSVTTQGSWSVDGPPREVVQPAGQAAVELIKEMEFPPNEPPDGSSFGLAMSSCMRAGMHEEVLELLADMRRAEDQRGVVPTPAALAAALHVYGELGKWQEAEKLMEEMRVTLGVTPKAFCYNALARAYARAGDWARAMDTLRDVRLQGCATDHMTFSWAITACEKAGQGEAALEVLSWMRQAGIVPELVVFNAVISACGKSFLLDRALEVRAELEAAGHRPDAYTYSALIHAHGLQGRWEDAEALLAQMEGQPDGARPNVVVYNAALAACALAGRVDRVRSLLARMREKEVAPDEKSYTTAISSAANTLWQDAQDRGAGDPPKEVPLLAMRLGGMVQGLLTDMRRRGLQPTWLAYRAALQVFAQAALWQDALQLIAEMEQATEPVVDSYLHNLVLRSLMVGQQWREAMKYYRDLEHRERLRDAAAKNKKSRKMQAETATPLAALIDDKTLELMIEVYRAAGEFQLADGVQLQRQKLHERHDQAESWEHQLLNELESKHEPEDLDLRLHGT